MDSTDTQYIFAIALHRHRELGLVAGAYLISPISDDTYKIEKNVIVDSAVIHSDRITTDQSEIIRSIQEISEKSLLKLFGRDAKTFNELLQKVQSDENLNSYIRNYIDRRICKAVEKAASANIPIYIRERNANNIYKEKQLIYHTEVTSPIFRFELDEFGMKYSLKIQHQTSILTLLPGVFELLTVEPCLIRVANGIYKVEGIDGRKFVPYMTKQFVTIPQQSVQKYMETFVLNAVRSNQVEAVGFEINEQKNRPKPILTLDERLSGGACLTLSFQYGNKVISANTPAVNEVKLSFRNNSYTFTRLTRNPEKEEKIKQQLIKTWRLTKVGENEYFPGKPENGEFDHYQVIEWLNTNYKLLQDEGFEIHQKFRQTNYYLSGFDLNLRLTESIDWFDLYGMVRIGEFEIPFVYFRKHIVKNIREFTLPNGQVFILPDEWFAKYRTILMLGKEEGESIKLSKASAAIIAGSSLETQSISSFTEKLKNINAKGVTLPHNLQAKLREYQTLGFAWLKTLVENGLNGCLADDMGLGKTLQTIALLLSELEANDFKTGQEHCSLVVAPTSIIYNWQKEFEKFAPQVKVGIYHGTQRDKSHKIFQQNHVVITSYGTIRNDIDLFKDFAFRYVVLDESQTIKNPASKIYRCVLLLKTKKSLCLSGTPIENNLFDLWSQMNFLNRGMLGGLKVFREEFAIPIERKNDAEKQKQLKKLIEPLIMRRTKEQVAKELPPLTEQIIYCEMTDEQGKAYEAEKSKARRLILDSLEQSKPESSTINVLSALTRLRQLANHPAMLDEYSNLSSGKFEEVTQMIESVIAENHKILIFSSFVKHLAQVETYLQNNGIGYEMLTGSTTDRSDVVEEFQNNPEKKIFLISLKAGGVGLNLTAADYIFILDPWWNPAAEMQAASRAHRIGQTRSVFVYRFITRNTVEEKIVKLQAHKENLAHEFVNSNNPMILLNKEQLISLVE